MLIQKVLEHITIEETQGNLCQDICGIQIDSRQVSQGQMFVAVRGTQNDGHQYIGKPHWDLSPQVSFHKQ